VDGLRRGKTWSDGGGTPDGYVCDPKGVRGLEVESDEGDVPVIPGGAPAAKTTGGIA
jgi:hypothetical protein